MPKGIRRSEPAHPATGTVIGADTITKPLVPDARDPGLIEGTSNEAMNKSSGHYDDQASPPKPNKPSGVHEVFNLTR